jgi:hypothetical protein
MVRIAFYSLTTLTALVGLFCGIRITGPRLVDPLDNWAHDPDGSFFRGIVVLFLSLIVLILVHLAHRLARVFELPPKTASPEQPASDIAGTPWEKDPGFTNR